MKVSQKKKKEFCVRLSVLRLFHVGHVVKNKRGALSLAWHEQAENERRTAGSSRCRQNLKYEISRCLLADYVKIEIASKSVPHVQQDYFSSLNQSNH